MTGPIALVGVPTALGGHLPGMDRTPSRLRAARLVRALADGQALGGAMVRDAGDVPVEPGFREDPDGRAKNRAFVAAMLERERDTVRAALRTTGRRARLAIVGGDCTAHAGALAGLRAAGVRRLGLVWFDAHGDFNTPDTTPSGNIWGMPLAMALGRGDPDLLAACDAPTVSLEHAALVGGQVLDEQEARDLVASPVALFGAGMVASDAGREAFEAWARTVGRRVDALYLAIDADCLDPSVGCAVQMPEPRGLALETVLTLLASLRRTARIAGVGVTGINLEGGGVETTLPVVVSLLGTALAADSFGAAGWSPA